jgi:hypothetical protein
MILEAIKDPAAFCAKPPLGMKNATAWRCASMKFGYTKMDKEMQTGMLKWTERFK